MGLGEPNPLTKCKETSCGIGGPPLKDLIIHVMPDASSSS